MSFYFQGKQELKWVHLLFSFLSSLQHSLFPRQLPKAKAISARKFFINSPHLSRGVDIPCLQTELHWCMNPCHKGCHRAVTVAAIMQSAAHTAWFWPWTAGAGTGCFSLMSLHFIKAPGEPKVGPAHSILPFSEGTYPSPGKEVSYHLFKRPAVFCCHRELLHLRCFHCCSKKSLYSLSVPTASRGNAITTNFFWVKPVSTFSLATRQSQCPILFRTKPCASPWECWCHHSETLQHPNTTSQLMIELSP